MGAALIMEHLCWETCVSECDGDGGNDPTRRKSSNLGGRHWFFSLSSPRRDGHPPEFERVTEGVRGCHGRPIEKVALGDECVGGRISHVTDMNLAVVGGVH